MDIYCSEDSGYRLGLKNAPYRNTCSLEREPSFLHQYNKGRKVAELTKEEERIKAEIQKNRDILDEGDLKDEEMRLLQRRARQLQQSQANINKKILYFKQL